MQRVRNFKLSMVTGPLVTGFAAVAILVAAFVGIGDHFVEDGQDGFDHRLSLALHDHATPNLTRLMNLATDLGSAPVTIPLMLGLLAWLWFTHGRPAVGVVAAAWIGAQLLDVVLKYLYQRDRPSLFPAFAKAGGYSFPSGHTVTALVTYGLIAGVLWHSLNGKWRWVPVVIAALIVAAVATSRVYLGVHYPSDVAGAILIGSAWLYVWLLVLARIRNGGWNNSNGKSKDPPVLQNAD